VSFAAAPRRPVDVFADLIVNTPAGRIAVTGDGSGLEIAADRLGTIRKAARPMLGGRSHRASRTPGLLSVLHASGVRVRVRVRSREIARTGDPARPGLLSRILGLPGVEVRPLALLTTLVSPRSR